MASHTVELIRRHPLLSGAISLLFAWGVLWSVVAVHFTARAVVEVTNLRHNELGIGVALALVYGWPAWLGLPVASLVTFRHSRHAAVILAVPALVAGLTFSYFYLFGDSELTISRKDEDTLDISWSRGEEKCLFQFVQGEIQATTPSTAAAEKLALIGSRLNAHVVGEEDLIPHYGQYRKGVFAGRDTWLGWPVLAIVLTALLIWRW